MMDDDACSALFCETNFHPAPERAARRVCLTNCILCKIKRALKKLGTRLASLFGPLEKRSNTWAGIAFA